MEKDIDDSQGLDETGAMSIEGNSGDPMENSQTKNFSNATKIEASNEFQKLKEMLKIFDSSSQKTFEIYKICETYSITRRVLYDFITILHALNVVDRMSNETFLWKGIKNQYQFVENIKNDPSLNSGCNFKQFSCDQDSHLSQVVVRLIRLFYYLGTEILDIRKVSKLFIKGEVKRRTMLRKLYTISSSLNVVGLIERTDQPATIKICVSPLPLTSIEILLNNSHVRNEEIFVARRKAFEECVKDEY
ncbi:transcription factor E2F7/8 [Histomonas meleagridis]|uniref:transcription factor E2F7/8 n=1 Tax=Histomonas meleagridis TaxID=135588 RepID=UPI00355A2449|nr:transcription factor E2F7/8 [Histomonas meleagridis]KAH0806849.1 transcription factor E2F7/8 [Histomonas meleagridis]